ncbi:MAG: hypothetical protein KatS3mg026_0349 [Bacteroidia bacterium]|nr:MAG: hypothetical protein KatS3mg026_0349 [Bacteroidia bacterium]
MVQLVPERELVGFFLVGGWLGYVAYWLEWYRKPFWLYAVLVAKIFAAWAFGWLYAHYYCHGDTLKAYLTAGRLAHYLWQEPSEGLALLFRELSSEWEARGWKLFWADTNLYGYDYEWSEPSNYFFYRLLVPVYAAAGGSYYGMQGLVALVSGLLGYAAYERWGRVTALPRRFWLYWFLWPSALFWASGALRDSWALPAMLYLSAHIAAPQGTFRLNSLSGLRELLGRLLWPSACAALVAGLRLEALPVAVAAGLLYRWGRYPLVWVGALLGGIGSLGVWAGPWAYQYRLEALDPGLHPDLNEASVFFLSFEPTFWGSLLGWLKAVGPGLAGPFPWQIQKPLVALYGLEAWAGTVLIGWALWQVARRRSLTLPEAFLVMLGVFVIGIIAMAMPYWGTLARQRLYGLYWIGLGLGIALQPSLDDRQRALRQP